MEQLTNYATRFGDRADDLELVNDAKTLRVTGFDDASP
jgi:hypothetical protein